MEYCSGGSVADLIAVSGEPLREDVIAYICSEALKVCHGLPKRAPHGCSRC